MNPSLPALLSLCLLAPLRGQCQDPAMPPNGFALVEQLDQLVTYQDGARTRIDVRFPQTAPGRCGWPVILHVHGFGGNRKDNIYYQKHWAQRGYLTAEYDVRGHGDFIALNAANPGTTVMGELERLDLVEIVDFLRARYGTGTSIVADLDRVGISGWSQGGVHAWFAAAWSGKALPRNARNLTRFPTFLAAIPRGMPLFDGELVCPQGKTIVNNALAGLFLSGPLVAFDPAWAATVQTKLLAEDFAGLAAFLDGDPFRNDLANLATSSVPVLFTGAWNDTWGSMDLALRALRALPSGTPRRAMLDAQIGHDCPDNDAQYEVRQVLMDRWFDRYVKGERNGVDSEAPIVATAIAESTARFVDPTQLAWNRWHDTWPPPATSSHRYWLRQGNRLEHAAPTAAEPTDRVTHQVAPGFGMQQYVQQAYVQVEPTKLAIPLSSVAYDSAPLAHDSEIAGSAKVRLEVTSSNRNYQVHCALFQLAAGSERFLGSGFAAVRDASAGARQLDVTVIPLDARLLAGDRLRLRVENFTERRNPLYDNFWVAPYFENAIVDVAHSDAKPSWIDVPLRDVVHASLGCPLGSVAVASPAQLRYVLEAGSANAGQSYAVVFGLSGTSSSNLFPGSTDPLRLTLDHATAVFLSAPYVYVPGTLGTLSAFGSGYAQVNLQALQPLPLQLVGTRLSAAAVVQTTAGWLTANPVDVLFR